MTCFSNGYYGRRQTRAKYGRFSDPEWLSARRWMSCSCLEAIRCAAREAEPVACIAPAWEQMFPLLCLWSTINSSWVFFSVFLSFFLSHSTTFQLRTRAHSRQGRALERNSRPTQNAHPLLVLHTSAWLRIFQYEGAASVRTQHREYTVLGCSFYHCSHQKTRKDGGINIWFLKCWFPHLRNQQDDPAAGAVGMCHSHKVRPRDRGVSLKNHKH